MNKAISVVYVEDDPDIRELVDIIFEREPGLTMVTLEPTSDVLQRIREAKPDLVLLDVMMPGMDGRTVALGMQSDVQLSNVPFVFMTAKARPQELQELHQLGALGIISKPFDPLTLANQVRAYVNKPAG